MADEKSSEEVREQTDPSALVRLGNLGMMVAVFVAAAAVTWFVMSAGPSEADNSPGRGVRGGTWRPAGPLDRAAVVIAAPEPAGEVVAADRVPVPLPTKLRLGRRGLVSLAVDMAQNEYARETLEPVLGAKLKLSESVSRCVVTALGLADPLHEPPAEALRAVRNAPAWPVARAKLVEDMGLSPEQAESARGVVCRQVVQGAFQSDASLETAREALARYCQMVDAQVEGVLVMAAAMQLARAGTDACGPIRRLAAERPVVGRRLAGAARCEQPKE